MKDYIHRYTSGFTLIELMMVLLIILVLSGASIAAFLNFNSSQAIITDSRNLEVELNRARSLAITLQYPSGCVSLRGVNVVSVEIDGKVSGIKTTALCSPADIETSETKVLFSSGITTPIDVTFLPRTGFTETGAEYQIVVTLDSDTTVTKTINIDSLGIISVQ